MASHKSLPPAVTVVVLMLIMLVGILAEKAFLENNIVYVLLLFSIATVILAVRQHRKHRRNINTQAN
ncbi:MAG: hypothetical protein QM664_01460 [Flavihumibacter sp.]